MFAEIPQNLILMVAGAFLLGWILAAINARMGGGTGSSKRDPRDTRIRSLEADGRVAKTELGSARSENEKLQAELEETQTGIEKRDNVISHQQIKLDETSRGLKISVQKTRELRAELSDRATESVRSEVKLREVETELSVAQASTDMIATGVLDYTVSDDNEDDIDDVDDSDASKTGA